MDNPIVRKKRLRVFAGPNGSGKSTFVQKFPIGNIKLGIFLNADIIEEELFRKGYLDLSQYNLDLSTLEIQNHFKNSKFSPLKLGNEKLFEKFTVEGERLLYDDHKNRNSYVASDVVDFFRNKLVVNTSDFSFETVMSDTNKIGFLEKAKNLGYYNYLYFFCTDDVEININRVQIRVKQNGHNVDPGLIKNRYQKSLGNIKPALKFVHRAYFFDNSGETSKL
ncbi:MAG: zeta toxin, partial [Leptospira sp.]|nr:zeta toxin [Leptospira sp.]